MKAARIRLIVAAVLMIGWLGYLGFLALGLGPPVIVSRSQLLLATHFVKADITIDANGKPSAAISVRESFGPNRIDDESVEVVNLKDAKRADGKPIAGGTYFIPLTVAASKQFRLAAGGDKPAHLVVYPWTEDVERQVKELVPSKQ